MSDKQKLNKYLKIINELRDKITRLELAIALLRHDVYSKYKEITECPSYEYDASAYACVIDLIDIIMKENNINNL